VTGSIVTALNIYKNDFNDLKLENLIIAEPLQYRQYNIFYLHTKFGDCYFSLSRDMIADIEIENGSCDPDLAPFRSDLSSVD